MTLLYSEEFEWPPSYPELKAKTKKALQLVIALLQGEPNDWDCYVLVNDSGQPVTSLCPSLTYTLRLRDNVPFTWLLRERVRCYEAEQITRTALKRVKMNPNLACYYFIAASPNGATLQYEGGIEVLPGRKYFLRVS